MANRYQTALEKLEELDNLVGQRYAASGEKGQELNRKLIQLYGEVQSVYREVIPQQRVQMRGMGKNPPTFPSYFEAGYLSGSTEYFVEGRNEVLKAIGAVRTLIGQQGQPGAAGIPRPLGNRLFLVHGHDHAVKETVARFLERLGLPVTILHEQPNQGRTLIEKFEAHTDVAFAVVLLTCDDAGGATKDGEIVGPLRPRARQNVIFELGFFIGRLGRGRVCALYEDLVELPSDVSGVAYVPLDDRGAWRLELARELRAAQLGVDMNDAV